MEYRDVSSSNIRSIGYDAESSILEIIFLSGPRYAYYDFPESLWFEFDSAESHGKFFHAHIKGHFREAQVG
jgi:hypothetical protein